MKTVGIAEFKAHLSSYLRAVRDGEVIAITDRGSAVAELGPARHNGLKPRAGKGNLRGIPLPPPNDIDFDIVEELLRDRARR